MAASDRADMSGSVTGIVHVIKDKHMLALMYTHIRTPLTHTLSLTHTHTHSHIHHNHTHKSPSPTNTYIRLHTRARTRTHKHAHTHTHTTHPLPNKHFYIQGIDSLQTRQITK